MFMVIGDVHYKSTPPRRRKDNYGECILAKLRWIASTGKRLGVLGYIFTGDIFDTARPPLRDVHALMEVLAEFDASRVVCVGNHDVIGHNSNDLSGTGIGVLIEAGLLNPRTEYAQGWDSPVAVCAQHYHPDYEAGGLPYNFGSTRGPEIRVTHGTVLDHVPPWEGYTLVQDIKIPDNCLIMNGHIHHPYEVGNFWNVGSLCRASIADQKVNHTPSVVVCRWHEDAWQVRRLPVPVEEDVWTEEIEIIEARDNEAIDEFVTNLEGEEISLAQGRDAALEELVKKGDYDESVRDTVFELLEVVG